MSELFEFARTIRLEHSLFALPFALGAAMLAEPPCPAPAALALLVACMVAARTAAMGFNRVADASFDARNPRTRDRAIPAGRLRRGTALALALASAAAFVAGAWGFWFLRGNLWPGLLALAFLAVLFGYSYTKRFTVLTHWVLGLCLGLGPVGAWIALRGSLALVPVLIGGGVLFWTAGFDILYALLDLEVDRREGLKSVPSRLGAAGARRVALASHAGMLLLLAPVPFLGMPGSADGRVGAGSLAALAAMAAVLGLAHVRARREAPEAVAAAFFPLNALVSILWLAGVVADVVLGLGARGPA
jgi:4-hydroxybenzoate polyprenyltransferase